MDWQALVLACRRANASYIENDDASKRAFEALGDVWVSQLQDDSHQAVLSVDSSGATWLSISGTRSSDGQLADVWRDVQLAPVEINGGHVTQGAASGMQNVFDWALSTAPSGAALNLTGHSLGAVSVSVAPAYVPAGRIGKIFSVAAPKFIAADFFTSHAAVFQRLTACVNSADGWASWPWFDRRWQYRAPVQTVWLKNDQGAFQMLDDGNKWPGGWRFSDHDIDSYQARLASISAMSSAPGVA
ncbi:hypothetical protein GCT13_08070 [Paraburkholderia sp. CNPSo 3157]|uniref:Lipase (Class 3) n=1 Tax=Paraburkholderia franconis TaxID=2654983 RepID=A0A7X1TF18_9BURK|nr:hypothetical protein [Paraburkholderia franconis]MPW16888.1 hypothetical protein [Paraburkholderia franconis]